MQNDILYKNIDSSLFDLSELSNKVDASIPHWEFNSSYFLSSSEIGRGMSAKDINNQISYSINNIGHRCDDISKLNTSEHNVLFAGCSNTFGDSLPYGTTWDHIIYETISTKIKNLGAFHSLGYPGGSASKIISNVFKYCYTYGNPKEIFILLPDYSRVLKYDKKNKELLPHIAINYLSNEVEPDTILEESLFEFQNYCRLLSIYCKSNNINLYISSWDDATTAVMSKVNLNNFYCFNFKKMDSFLNSFDTESLIKKGFEEYLWDGRDKNHHGLVFHQWFANNFIEWRSNENI
jgi:hypothetical protein